MATRAQKKEARRQSWHQQRINDAETPRQQLWAACGWLVAEAWRARRLSDATDAVLAKVHEIREENTDDRNRYAA
jgi:hypothetical protein